MRSSVRPVEAVRVLAAMLLGFVLVPLLPLPAEAQVQAPGKNETNSKIEQPLREELSQSGTVAFWVRLEDRADLAQAKGVPDWAARGKAVTDALVAVAERSQAGLKKLLSEKGAPHQPFWISNAIWAQGDKQLADELASRPEVVELRAARTYQIPEPTPAVGGEPRPSSGT